MISFLFKLLLFFVVLYFVLILISNKYYNPYFIECLFAPPGVGKTIVLSKLGYQHKKKKWEVFSTDSNLGYKFIPPEKLGKFVFDKSKDNLLLIDEVSILYNNRNYKTFSKELITFFKKHRHQHVKIIMASQDYADMDKVIRKLCTRYYILDRFCGLWVRGRRVKKNIALTQAMGEQCGTIAEEYVYDSFWSRGSRVYAFLPRWINTVDSYDLEGFEGLPLVDDIIVEKSKKNEKVLDKTPV